MYVCLCYVLDLVVIVAWYSSCSDTRSLLTQLIGRKSEDSLTLDDHTYHNVSKC